MDTITTEAIHLRRDGSAIPCGATGPVRITRCLSEVTCAACALAEDVRQGRVEAEPFIR